MKKFLISICLLSICITCITGCSFSASDQEQAQEQASDMVENLTRAADEISQGGILEELEETEGDAVGIEAEDDETQKSEISGQDVELEEDLEGNAYDYTQLSAQEQELYRTILAALQECASDVAIDMVEESSFDKVFQCVMNDHPEIFYVDGYTFIKYTKGDKLKGNAFSGSYLYSQEEIEERNVRIEEKTEEILRQMPDGDEYEKVKYIYEYIIANTEYVQGAEDNQNICSVFLGGRSVCQGYAKAAQYLFEKAGIYSIFVSGKVESGEDHAWNIVRIDGNYYYIDTTWGDASYVMSGADASYEGKVPQINYEYLCVPDSQLFRTHTVGKIVPLPSCTSMEANYYVREGAYFTQADMEKAADLFEKAYEDGTSFVTLKCADETVYNEMEYHLIECQEVFRYLQSSDGTVAYTNNPKQLALSFWL